MVAAGFDIGHQGDQVTVAKQRTMLQTQTMKSGEVDVSCKDFVLSWGSHVERATTRCTPDLYSEFGVERGTEKTWRLPNTLWPFDHSGVAVSFKAPARESIWLSHFRKQRVWKSFLPSLSSGSRTWLHFPATTRT
jgi:hypothetical protein